MAQPQGECDDCEDIVRAIQDNHYHRSYGRLSSDWFKGEGTSVSRLAIRTLETLWQVFLEEIDKPRFPVVGAGEINVGHLMNLAASGNPPAKVSVVPAPTRTNPAHAEVPEKVPKWLRRKIIDAVKIHDAPYATPPWSGGLMPPASTEGEQS